MGQRFDSDMTCGVGFRLLRIFYFLFLFFFRFFIVLLAQKML
jgi:hypothetical protein